MQFKRPNPNVKVWHNWFAWFPVTQAHDDGSQTTFWLETVQRRAVHIGPYPGGIIWEYKAKPAEIPDLPQDYMG